MSQIMEADLLDVSIRKYFGLEPSPLADPNPNLAQIDPTLAGAFTDDNEGIAVDTT